MSKSSSTVKCQFVYLRRFFVVFRPLPPQTCSVLRPVRVGDKNSLIIVSASFVSEKLVKIWSRECQLINCIIWKILLEKSARYGWNAPQHDPSISSASAPSPFLQSEEEKWKLEIGLKWGWILGLKWGFSSGVNVVETSCGLWIAGQLISGKQLPEPGNPGSYVSP